jgi:signal transduction histidine kinase/tetratricopeptide (TPR) repeat protein
MKKYVCRIAMTLSLTLSLEPGVLAQNATLDSLKSLLGDQSGKELVNTLNELSWYYKGIDLDTAYLFAQSALEESETIDSDSARSASFNSLGNVMEAKGNVDSALYFHQAALSIKEKLRDTLGLASSLNNLGILYDEMGKYAVSLQSYFRSLEYYDRFGTPEDVAMVSLNIGIVYKKQEEFDKVLYYYLKALDIYNATNNSFGKTVLSGNIGSIHINLENYDSVIYYSKKAVSGYQSLGYDRYVPYSDQNIGIAFDSLGQVDSAKWYYQKSLQGHKEYSNEFELANVYTSLSNHHLKNLEINDAVRTAKAGLIHAENVQAAEFITQLYATLAKGQARQGLYRNAFKSYQQYVIGRDSIYEKEKIRQIFELETKYETEKKEQQIALQQAQISEEQARNQVSLFIIFGLSLFLILLVILVLLIRSRSRKKELLIKQEAELKLKEMQIEASIESQEAERARFAKDLHDGFGQMISILNLNLKSLDGPKADRHQIFENSTEVLDGMYKELKDICFDLMPETLIKTGLDAALNEFASRINRTGQVHVETDFFGMENRLEDMQEVSLYRIAQEWVNNILKYAKASHVTLQITRENEDVTMLIEDDGPGFDRSLLIENKKGNGWKNIQSRINLIKGTIELDTVQGRKGSTLIIDFKAKNSLISSTQKDTAKAGNN